MSKCRGIRNQYRDFVLSRLRGQPDLLDVSPNTREQDKGWNVEVPVIFAPDGRLNEAQKAIIETDYGMTQGQLVVPSRRALVKYVLQHHLKTSTDVFFCA